MVKAHKSIRNLTKSDHKDLQQELPYRLDQKEVEQQHESGSVTPSSDHTDSTDSYLKQFGAGVEEEINIFDLLQRTDTESSEDEQQENPFEQADFLELFGEVPNVEDVSEDISIASQSSNTPIILQDYSIKKDKGKFVDPLTGLELDDSGESKTSKSEDQQVASREIDDEEAAVVYLKNSESSALSELLLTSDALEEEKAQKEVYVDETLAAFFKLEKEPSVIIEDEIDWETSAQRERAKAFQQHTLNFLKELINKVVSYSEHLSPEKFLQKNLDKQGLIIELSVLWPKLQSLRNICSYLNRQVVRHFRRKKSFRYIIEDNPNTVLQDKQKLVNAKEHLDQALAKEKHLIQMSTQLQAELNQKYKNLKQETENHIETFENQIRQHFHREGYHKMKAEIERCLLQVSKYRQEISEVRLTLLLQQHSEAKLHEQINKMNDLGNGLDMRSFNTLQAENQTLNKKIEERNADLNKLYNRCHNNIHVLAHFKENEQMFCHTIEVQRTILATAATEKRLLREHLFSLKLQRNRVHGKIKKLRIQGGILAKPALMYDYDQTVKRVAEQKEKLEYLRRTFLSTQSKIEQIICNADGT